MLQFLLRITILLTIFSSSFCLLASDIDSDGDGLTDEKELLLGTNPNSIDSDLDSYTDFEEYSAGKNPLDNKSYIYEGGWPFNPNKDNIQDSGFNNPCPGGIGCDCGSDNDCANGNCGTSPKGSYCMPDVGNRIPRFVAQDQFGDFVDLYDFANQGKLVVIEMSAAWCKPCNELAGWMTYDENEIKSNRWWKPEYEKVKEKVRNGEIYFINIQYEDYYHDTTNPDSIEEWFSTYPEDNVPILMDNERKMHGWARPTGLPAIFVVDENMNFVRFTGRGLNIAFDYIVGIDEKKSPKATKLTKERYKAPK